LPTRLANEAQIALTYDFPAVLLLRPSQLLQHLSSAVELALASNRIRLAEVHATRACVGIDEQLWRVNAQVDRSGLLEDTALLGDDRGLRHVAPQIKDIHPFRIKRALRSEVARKCGLEPLKRCGHQLTTRFDLIHA